MGRQAGKGAGGWLLGMTLAWGAASAAAVFAGALSPLLAMGGLAGLSSIVAHLELRRRLPLQNLLAMQGSVLLAVLLREVMAHVWRGGAAGFSEMASVAFGVKAMCWFAALAASRETARIVLFAHLGSRVFAPQTWLLGGLLTAVLGSGLERSLGPSSGYSGMSWSSLAFALLFSFVLIATTTPWFLSKRAPLPSSARLLVLWGMLCLCCAALEGWRGAEAAAMAELLLVLTLGAWCFARRRR